MFGPQTHTAQATTDIAVIKEGAHYEVCAPVVSNSLNAGEDERFSRLAPMEIDKSPSEIGRFRCLDLQRGWSVGHIDSFSCE